MSFLRESEDSERRSQRWDRQAGAGNYLVLVAGQGTSAVLALAALWLASRAVGTSGYGAIVGVVAASQLIGQLAVQWTAIAVFRHGCEEFVESGRIASSFWNRLFILFASLALVFLSSPLWLPPLSGWLSLPPGAHWLLLAHLTSTALAAHVQQSLHAAKLPRFQSIVQMCEKAILVAVLVALTASSHTSWTVVATVFVLAPVIATTIGLVRLRHLILPVAALDPTLIRRMMHFSLPLVFYSIVGYLTTNHIDAFFILHFLSAASLGIYALSYQLAGSFMQIPSLAGSLLMALFITASARGEGERLRHFFGTTLPSLTLVWSLGCALAAVVGAALVTRVFDPSFRPAGELLWPLMTAAAFAGPVSVGFGPLANARSKTIIPALAAGAAACTNLVLNFALVPRFGLLGCAWATATSFAVSLLLCARLVCRLEPIPVGPIVLATTPALVGAVFAHHTGGWMGLGAAFTTAAVLAFLNRDVIKGALAGTEVFSFIGGEPAPEVVE